MTLADLSPQLRNKVVDAFRTDLTARWRMAPLLETRSATQDSPQQSTQQTHDSSTQSSSTLRPRQAIVEDDTDNVAVCLCHAVALTQIGKLCRSVLICGCLRICWEWSFLIVRYRRHLPYLRARPLLGVLLELFVKFLFWFGVRYCLDVNFVKD